MTFLRTPITCSGSALNSSSADKFSDSGIGLKFVPTARFNWDIYGRLDVWGSSLEELVYKSPCQSSVLLLKEGHNSVLPTSHRNVLLLTFVDKVVVWEKPSFTPQNYLDSSLLCISTYLFCLCCARISWTFNSSTWNPFSLRLVPHYPLVFDHYCNTLFGGRGGWPFIKSLKWINFCR